MLPVSRRNLSVMAGLVPAIHATIGGAGTTSGRGEKAAVAFPAKSNSISLGMAGTSPAMTARVELSPRRRRPASPTRPFTLYPGPPACYEAGMTILRRISRITVPASARGLA